MRIGPAESVLDCVRLARRNGEDDGGAAGRLCVRARYRTRCGNSAVRRLEASVSEVRAGLTLHVRLRAGGRSIADGVERDAGWCMSSECRAVVALLVWRQS